MNIIKVWKPKYSTKEILVAVKKIKRGENFVEITKDLNYKDFYLKFNSQDITETMLGTNGVIQVVYVPISKMVKVTKANVAKL